MAGVLLCVLGILVGVLIRRVTKFIYPTDFLTYIVCISVTVVTILIPMFGLLSFQLTGIFSVSYIIGYMTGYCIDGFRAYVIVRKHIAANKLSVGKAWVLYKVDGRTAIALQTNYELWQRLVRKNHRFILCSVPFGEPDWTEETKFPLFPKFVRKMIMVDSYAMVKVSWSIDIGVEKHPQRMSMLVKKVHGSMVSIDELCFEEEAVAAANAATAEAQEKYTKLVHFVKAGLPRMFANFLADSFDKAPAMSFFEVTKRADDLIKETKKDEMKIELLPENEKVLKDQNMTEAAKTEPKKEVPDGNGETGKKE